jgi:hypothetical protein
LRPYEVYRPSAIGHWTLPGIRCRGDDGGMSANRFLYVRPGRRAGLPDPSPELAAYAATRRRALELADRACCCPARPVVMAIMPMTSAEGEPIDLLLCAHHYRLSRQGLAAAGAVAFDSRGLPPTDEPEPEAAIDHVAEV